MKLSILMWFITVCVPAQSLMTGKWKTVDDHSGKIRSLVEIYERNGRLYGRIVALFDVDDRAPICDKCPKADNRYGKKILGMEIMRNLKKSEEGYMEGDILDPEEGKVYRCKLWMEGDELKVRGYWGIFYRTQTWWKSS